jgi:hypothetical protein
MTETLVALLLVCKALSVGTAGCAWPNGSGLVSVVKLAQTFPLVETRPGPKPGMAPQRVPRLGLCQNAGAEATKRLTHAAGVLVVVQCVVGDSPGLNSIPLAGAGRSASGDSVTAPGAIR